MVRARFGTLLAAGLIVAATACTASDPALPPDLRLDDPRPCPDSPGFTCASFTVPLDRSGKVPGDVVLRVAVADNADAARGTLLVLTGGPGQPGVSFVERIRERLHYLLDDYRLVMIDQRGTGAEAIDCPKLQAEVGASDITPPSAGAVQECADLIGPARDFYTTADTVADLEELRRRLGVQQWTVDGVSYGSFVAAHYGLTYPQHVTRMVLDSVVPHTGVPAIFTGGMRAAAFVLREACREQGCDYDPVQELAVVVRRHGNPVGILDVLVIGSIFDPKLTDDRGSLLDLLHRAAQGDPSGLNQRIEAIQGSGIPPEVFSSGLHAATLCADLVQVPWGGPDAPLAGRRDAVEVAASKLTDGDVWPFTVETAIGQGSIETCVAWPQARPHPRPPNDTLPMPVLLLAGDRDLSTPVEWAHQQAAACTDGKLVIIKGMGHSIQGRHPEGDAAVRSFLLT